MTRMKPLIFVAAGAVGLAAVVGSGTLATAAPSASATIAARQANFKTIGKSVKTIKDELSGGANAARIAAAAKTIAATGRKQAALFPAGTGPSAGVKTDALAKIWSNRSDFDADMKAMIAEADKLAAVARTGNAGAIGDQFKAMGKTCGGCHREFRADN